MVLRAMAVMVAATVAAGSGAQVSEEVLPVFRAQAEVERGLLATHLADLERIQSELRTESDRLVRLLDDLLRAEREGEDVEGFVARSTDIREAEGAVQQLIAAAQQVRSMITIRRGTLTALEREINRLQAESRSADDRLSGRWDVVVEPGENEGVFDLQLNGTLVTGVYQLAGGWTGSLRGTYIGKNLRMERIDSEAGFVAVFTGRLVGEDRLAGTWQSTNLASGMPTSGSWVAQRREER